jgi:predicted phage tail component-like protein
MGAKLPAMAPVNRIKKEVGGKPGAYLVRSDIGIRELSIPVLLINSNFDNFELLKEDLAEWLYHEEAKTLEFSDEPNRIYYAFINQSVDIDELVNKGRGTLNFVCYDPFKYGPERTYTFPSDYVSVTNEGTHEAKPIFELEVLTPVTFAMIQNQYDEYMMIGKPTSVQQTLVNDRNVVLDERGESLSSWQTSPTEIDGTNAVIGGTIGTDGTGVVPFSYGTGPAWHGPALVKEVPVIQDFEVEMRCRVELDRSSDTFRIETYLFDEGLNVIGKLAIVDNTINISQIAAEGRYGDFRGINEGYAISSRNYLQRAQHFHGVLRLTRRGNNFEFYVARLATGTVIPKHYDVLRVSYTDISQSLTGKLKYVQMHFGKFGSSTSATVPRINQLKVTELVQTTEDQTPYIAYPGDIITFDHKDEEMLLNGENVMRLKDFGAKFFELQKGTNEFVVHPSDAFSVSMKFRETFK